MTIDKLIFDETPIFAITTMEPPVDDEEVFRVIKSFSSADELDDFLENLTPNDDSIPENFVAISYEGDGEPFNIIEVEEYSVTNQMEYNEYLEDHSEDYDFDPEQEDFEYDY